MSKNLFYIIISVIIIVVFGFQFLLIRKQSNLTIKLYNNVEQMEHQVSILKHNYFSSWKLERGVLNIDDIYDEDAQKIDDGFVNHEQPVLLFRFSKINCTECVVKQIDIIKELIQSNVVKYKMICDYSKDKRSLGIFKRMNKIKDTVYNCEKLIDNEPGTLYFCIYYKGFVSDVFFPNEDFPELTKNYLKEMSTKYFNVK